MKVISTLSICGLLFSSVVFATNTQATQARDTHDTMATKATNPAYLTVEADKVNKSHTNKMVRDAQKSLSEMGYYEGKVDGKMGPMTSAAVMDYQAKYNLERTGELNKETFDSLTGANQDKQIEGAIENEEEVYSE